MDDARLLERSRRGDADAFSELFAKHQRAIYRYGVYMCGDGAGDDTVQETFLAVLRQTDRYDAPKGTVRGYLIGVARHVILKRLGSRPGVVFADPPEATLDRIPAIDGAHVLDELTQAETADAIRLAIRTLPDPYREVVLLCELEELDYAAAALVMQCPVGTVRSRLHRARAMLAGTLAEFRQRRSHSETPDATTRRS